ncbi:hypothetical protein Anapl_06817 [Anas platyrhynchos]|uniref:Uncharacterized protein n=1 Tax=Anas platyrhynchos TaxID=8839 RepID=R0M4N4_ANAPL|nr:hypothetical protein Anapl_06817 [Anas platyrhynchos]
MAVQLSVGMFLRKINIQRIPLQLLQLGILLTLLTARHRLPCFTLGKQYLDAEQGDQKAHSVTLTAEAVSHSWCLQMQPATPLKTIKKNWNSSSRTKILCLHQPLLQQVQRERARILPDQAQLGAQKRDRAAWDSHELQRPHVIAKAQKPKVAIPYRDLAGILESKDMKAKQIASFVKNITLAGSQKGQQHKRQAFNDSRDAYLSPGAMLGHEKGLGWMEQGSEMLKPKHGKIPQACSVPWINQLQTEADMLYAPVPGNHAAGSPDDEN